MNVLFEEDGSFKAGTVLADNVTSMQVELPAGRRVKLKAAHVLLRFAAPTPADLLKEASTASAAMDADFLWQVCGDEEFAFTDLATEYCGATPSAVESAAVLMCLHAAPVYFHRKGRGRFRRAPAEILQAALAAVEKKRQQAAAVARMSAELAAGRLPAEFPPLLPELLYQPDRNKLETRALEAACAAQKMDAIGLLARCGALPDSHDFHLGRFLYQYFRGGAGFPPLPADALNDWAEELPLTDVSAFSIDDAHTTEIDDAFSLQRHADGHLTVGIHIAVPALGFAPDSELGRIARQRLSTVYMPGKKITMLPDEVIERYTLLAGKTAPALSLYLQVAKDLTIQSHHTRLEQVPIAANLRHHDLEPLFNAATLAAGLSAFPYAEELRTLWELAVALEAARGAANQTNRRDYAFVVDWEISTAQGKGRISISGRPRGSPLDTLVAELMIHANATWGAELAQAQIAALYRVQTAGKARISSHAAAHEGMGVRCYAWASSPLRRYCDLVNQWQLLAWLRQTTPRWTAKDAEFLALLRDFEQTYAAYAEHQRNMERYWCLRWLLQENVTQTSAVVLKENLVRLEAVPLVLRVPALPEKQRGARVEVAIENVDLLAAGVRLRYLETLPTSVLIHEIDELEDAEIADAAADSAPSDEGEHAAPLAMETVDAAVGEAGGMTHDTPCVC